MLLSYNRSGEGLGAVDVPGAKNEIKEKQLIFFIFLESKVHGAEVSGARGIAKPRHKMAGRKI